MNVIQTRDAYNLNQRLAKQGKFFRAIATSENVSNLNITFEIPAGRYIQISRVVARFAEAAISDGKITLTARIGGDRGITGVAIPLPNYNDLNPKISDIPAFRDTTITGVTTDIILTEYAVKSTNQTSDNATYLDESIYIFGDDLATKLVTLEISTVLIIDFMGIFVSFCEVDPQGNEIE